MDTVAGPQHEGAVGGVALYQPSCGVVDPHRAVCTAQAQCAGVGPAEGRRFARGGLDARGGLAAVKGEGGGVALVAAAEQAGDGVLVGAGLCVAVDEEQVARGARLDAVAVDAEAHRELQFSHWFRHVGIPSAQGRHRLGRGIGQFGTDVEVALRIQGFLPLVLELQQAAARLVGPCVRHEGKSLLRADQVCADVVGASLDDGHRVGQCHAAPGTCAELFGLSAGDNLGVASVFVRLPHAYLVGRGARQGEREDVDGRDACALVDQQVLGRESLHVVQRIHAADVQLVVRSVRRGQVYARQAVAQRPAQGVYAVCACTGEALHAVHGDDECVGHVGRHVVVGIEGVHAVFEQSLVLGFFVVVAQCGGRAQHLVVAVDGVGRWPRVFGVALRGLPCQGDVAAARFGLQGDGGGRHGQCGVVEVNAAGVLGDAGQGEVGAASRDRLARGQGSVREGRHARTAREGSSVGSQVSVREGRLRGLAAGIGADRIHGLRVKGVEGVERGTLCDQIFIGTVDQQSAAGQRAVEVAALLAVFQDEIFAGDRRVDAIGHRFVAGGRHVAHLCRGAEQGGGHPSHGYFLPHIDGSGAVAVFAVPCARAHQVPYACAAVAASALFVVGIIEVRCSQVVAEFMADDADVRQAAVALLLGFDGVAAHGDAVDGQSVDFAAVRPDVCAASGHFLSHALVDDGQSVQYAVAIVVKLCQVYFVLYHE